ncbi:uncharacterized protein LOC133307873 [Gastrolobium bilobum]|uniref:uncharacterized protein LOC133307873 n=1 Tax=Gastrolobium bilobum TaxID=150636 RepID=UPI002AB0DC8D|nr:uncharacterized protein LOC133307873 [Gastrolobium bilobum]
MAESSSAKRARFEKQGHASLTTLPSDLGLEILGRVASHSIKDISNVKLTCKELLHLAEHDSVYKKSSLEKFACVHVNLVNKEKPFSHRVDNRCDNGHEDQYIGTLYNFVYSPEEIYSMYRQALFLRRCRKSGNPELLYRDGMVIFFQQNCCSFRENLALQNLKNAALTDHIDAKYVYCTLLMVSEDKEKRNHGLEMFCSLKMTIDLDDCKQRVRSFLRGMWVRRKVVPIHDFSFCNSTICKALNVVNNLDDREITCEYCHADAELKEFCNI